VSLVATDCKIYLGAYDISGDSRMVEWGESSDALEDTTFGATAKGNNVGLDDVSFQAQGFNGFAAAGMDAIISGYARVGTLPVTVAAEGGDVGEMARFFKSLRTAYSPISAGVGELVPFAFSAANGNACAVRGVIGATGSKSSTSQGAAYNLGAVAAGKRVYGALHVLSASGAAPTLDVTVESDSLEAFSSATTVLTFAQKSAIGYDWQQSNGSAITDGWWRVKWTLGGGTPVFGIVVAIGIA
jgi:hypothetical protein